MATLCIRLTLLCLACIVAALAPFSDARAFPTDSCYSAGFQLREGRLNPQIPTPPKPALRQVYRETTFGTCMIRATDHATQPPVGFARNDYSRRQAFNVNNTYFLIYSQDGSWHLYDANTLAYIRRLPGLAGDAEPQWHASDPNLLYYLPTNGGTQIRWMDVRTTASSIRVDFRGRLPTWASSAAHIWTRSEGSPSANGRYWGLVVQDANFNTLGYIVWDMVGDRLVGSRKTTEFVDTVTMSAGGRWFIENNANRGVWAWSPDFTRKKLIDRTYGIHSDAAWLPNGQDAYVSVDYESANGDVYMTNLDKCPSVPASATTASLCPRTVLFSMYPQHSWSTMHFSTKSYQRRGWVLVSTYDWGSNVGTRPWYAEKIFALELKANPRVYQIAFTHRVRNPNGNDTNAINYWNEPHASVNRDFTRIIFNSNWHNTADTGVDAYILSLPRTALGGAAVSSTMVGQTGGAAEASTSPIALKATNRPAESQSQESGWIASLRSRVIQAWNELAAWARNV